MAAEKTQAEIFYECYGEEFKGLLDIPTVALCRCGDSLVPYEYSNNMMRYRRLDSELDEHLKSNLKRLVVYCFKNEIRRDRLLTIAGGNLWDYNIMKNLYQTGA